MEATEFHHVFQPGTGRPVLVLHGTGGDENSLVDIARRLAPDSPLLSVRGKSMDEGVPRFFRRLREGVFDQKDLALKTGELAEFLRKAPQRFGIDLPFTGIGYSNGANMALSLLFRHPETTGDLLLLRPMIPFEPELPLDLSDRRILISAGSNDPIVPRSEPVKLKDLLKARGAQVELIFQPTGHSLNSGELDAARAWLALSAL